MFLVATLKAITIVVGEDDKDKRFFKRLSDEDKTLHTYHIGTKIINRILEFKSGMGICCFRIDGIQYINTKKKHKIIISASKIDNGIIYSSEVEALERLCEKGVKYYDI